MEQTKKITKMKQETKATIAYLAAIIFVIICIALMAVTPAYGQNQTVIKDSKGEVVYIKIKTASGYIVKDKNGVLLYTVVENDTEKRVYDASGRLISVEKKAKKMKTMKDQVTSIEQSKRLIDLGVPAEKASMIYQSHFTQGVPKLYAQPYQRNGYPPKEKNTRRCCPRLHGRRPAGSDAAGYSCRSWAES